MLYFIVNTESKTGQGKKIWHKLHIELKNREISFKAFETKYPGHATKLAERISLIEGEKDLVVVGGDGTINEVINGIKDFSNLRFAVIPNGSGNDFGRGMKLKKDPMKNLNRILEITEKPTKEYTGVDLGLVTYNEQSKFFAISAGIGLDAIVCRDAQNSGIKKVLNKVKLGKLTYIILTVLNLFRMETADATMTMKNDLSEGGTGNVVTLPYKKLIFMAAMNQFAEGGGVPMAPEASCMDGKLSFSSASGIPKTKTFFCLPLLVAKKQKYIKGFEIVDAEVVKMEMEKPMILHADGEYCGEVKEVTFTCLPGKLHYMM